MCAALALRSQILANVAHQRLRPDVEPLGRDHSLTAVQTQCRPARGRQFLHRSRKTPCPRMRSKPNVTTMTHLCTGKIGLPQVRAM